jgi:hypothetical protein
MYEEMKVAVFFNPRVWFFLVALACAGLIGFALYKQHMDFVDPYGYCRETPLAAKSAA